MKVKFSRIERLAGVFVLVSVVGAVGAMISVAVQKGWFESKVTFKAYVETAEGLYQGTPVQISGLRAGSVASVELREDQKIQLNLFIFKRFAGRVKRDSEITIIRPFVIGEKVLDLSIGNDGEPLTEGSFIPIKKSADLMDLLSGRTLGPLLTHLESLSANLSELMVAFSDRERLRTLIRVFDRLEPLVNNLTEMSKGLNDVTMTMNRKKRLEHTMVAISEVSQVLNEAMPELAKEAPEALRDLPHLVTNLNSLSQDLRKLTPAIEAVAPELPRASARAIEALDEAVITLKAMQKTFLLRGAATEVKQEESDRTPASNETTP